MSVRQVFAEFQFSFCEVLLLKIKNTQLVFFILKSKTFCWYCEGTQIKLFAASNYVYSYLYEEKL